MSVVTMVTTASPLKKKLSNAASFSASFSTGASAPVSALLKKTALYRFHNEMNAKMIEFGGYMMPLQYGSEGIVQSCLHTRASASLFDTSHMGVMRITGKDRTSFLERLTVGEIKGMEISESRLTLLTNEAGGIIDDSIVTVQEKYIRLVVNAGCREKDLSHIQNKAKETAEEFPSVGIELMENVSLLALQGPSAEKVLQPLLPSSVDLKKLMFMRAIDEVTIDGVSGCSVSRSGYTGEDGFEIFIPNEFVESIASRLLSNPAVKLAGLGARDVLRLEAGFCLYGHDINESTTPIEASLSWTIGKRRKVEGGFLGAEKILKQLTSGVAKKRVGLRTDGPAAREGCQIFTAAAATEASVVESGTARVSASVPVDSTVGSVTSGTHSPTLKTPIAMGYVKTEKAKVGTKLVVNIKNIIHQCFVVKMPFVPNSFYRGSS